jgi:WD40 repeat protein
MATMEHEEPKAKVFISYSRKDIDFADKLEAALKARGFETLIDREEIYAFEDWWTRIETLISRADTVVFMLSPDAVASEIALKEVTYAASLNKRFAPIVYRRVPDEAVPQPLRRLNYVYFDEPAQFETSADRLTQALQTDISWIRRHTEYGEIARNWSVSKRPGGLLLRSPSLEEAERWISSRPRRAPAPTEETKNFVAESRRSATRRRNILTSSLAAGLLLSLSLAGLVFWQRGVAVKERDLAEQSASQAKAEKERADKSAADAQLSAADARAQRDIAQLQTAAAEKQAALATARAELNQAQLISRDAPREALRRAYGAAQKLDELSSGGDALVGLSKILSSVREIPLPGPYGHYNLGDATVISRQKIGDGPVDIAVNGRSAKRPLTVIGTYDLTGVIDDNGRAVALPIGSGEVDRSYANDATWLDDNSFILATGAWRKVNALSDPFSLFNAALRRYRVDGTLIEEYVVDHPAPVTAVAVFKSQKGTTIIAGDAFGNLIVKPLEGKLAIIPTGVIAPVKRIIIESDSSNVVVLFGHSATARVSGPIGTSSMPNSANREVQESPAPPEDGPPIPDIQKSFDIGAQLKKLLVAIELPVSVSYLGNNPADDLGCAIMMDQQLYVCNRSAVDVWYFKPEGGLADRPDHTFPAQNASVTALAASPDSPLIAAGYADGQVRLWLTNRALLSELYKDEKASRVSDSGSAIGALGFIAGGQRLLSSSTNQLVQWDLEDVVSKHPTAKDEESVLNSWKQHNWVSFQKQPEPLDVAQRARLKELLAANTNDALTQLTHGRFLITVHSGQLNLVDMEHAVARNLPLPGHHIASKEWTPSEPQEDRLIVTGSGSTICVLHGAHDRTFDDRKLYKIDEESGSIEAEWSWPEDLKNESVAALAVHRSGGETTCWAGVGKSLVVFSAHHPVPQRITIGLLTSQRGGNISQLAPIDNSDVFAMAAQSSLRSSIIVLARINFAAPGADTTVDASATASIISSQELSARVDGIAVNPDKSLFAVALGDQTGPSDVTEVRLFDWSFSTIMSLPGITGSFNNLRISDDGATIRGTTWGGLNYEQAFSLSQYLDRARNRLNAWTEHDDWAALIEKGDGEKDWGKATLIFEDAANRNPSDAQTILRLATRKFYTARGADDQKHALLLYDKACAFDPHDPIIYYMRGRARAIVGDKKGASDDFTAAIQLPHILPRVKVIAGFLGLNYGISKLSEQLNLQSRAELFLRRAATRTGLGDWQSVVADISWIRKNSQPPAIGYELEALAWDSLQKPDEAANSYQQAAKALKEAKSWAPFEELSNYANDAAWRSFKLASYELRVARIFRKMGREEDAMTASATAQDILKDAYASSDLTAKARMRLDQLADRTPNSRCTNESQYRSIDGDQAIPISFFNQYASPLRVYWLDYDGHRKLYSNVGMGNSYTVFSFMTHPWLIADSNDNCIGIYLASEQAGRITIQRARLGIVMADSAPRTESAAELNRKEGVLIKEIIPQSAAESAGLKPGDVLVKLNDTKVDSVKDAQSAIQASGAVLVIEILRDGSELIFKANLGN